jgi:hypothetical protein
MNIWLSEKKLKIINMVRVKEIKSDTELRNEVGGEQICYHPQIEKLTIGEGELTAFLSDGRKTTIPIS